MVELMRDMTDELGGQVADQLAVSDVEADQAVGVFNAAFLSRSMRLTGINRHTCEPFHLALIEPT